MKLIDPLKIPKEDFPLIALSSNSTSLISWAILWRTKGMYNHTFWYHKPGICASQDLIFREKSIKTYIKPGCRMKFWKVKGLTQNFRNEVYRIIRKRMEKPWWKRRYDFLGIVGQATGIKLINNPFTTFCSEQMACDLSRIVQFIPGRPSPAQLNELFKVRNGDFEYYGHYIYD